MTAKGETVASVEQVMGMPISVHLRGRMAAGPAAASAVAAVFDQLRSVEAMFSTYRRDSQISAINRGELTVAEADPLVRSVLEHCADADVACDGVFSPYRPAGFERSGQVPGLPGRPYLDPAGLVKGWAIERAAGLLADLVGVDYCLNGGGDLVVGGTAGGGPWRIGIEDPGDVGRIRTTVTVESGAVATSGTARRGAHIWQPATGAAATGLLAVTVIGPSLMLADVYATAAFAMGRAGLGWLAGRDGYAGMVVTGDGTALVTSTWPVVVGAAG